MLTLFGRVGGNMLVDFTDKSSSVESVLEEAIPGKILVDNFVESELEEAIRIYPSVVRSVPSRLLYENEIFFASFFKSSMTRVEIKSKMKAHTEGLLVVRKTPSSTHYIVCAESAPYSLSIVGMCLLMPGRRSIETTCILVRQSIKTKCILGRQSIKTTCILGRQSIESLDHYINEVHQTYIKYVAYCLDTPSLYVQDNETMPDTQRIESIVSVIKGSLSRKYVLYVHRQSIKNPEFVLRILNKTFETVEINEERILSMHVLPGSVTIQGTKSIKSPEFDTGALSQILEMISKEINICRYLSAAYEELRPSKESQCDDVQQENENDIRKLGTSNKRIPTQDLLKPSWSLINLPSIKIPGVAAISISVNPCVTDIRSRRISTKTHLFGELIGQALEDHKKKVKKFAFLVRGFVHGCKSQVDYKKTAYDVRSKQGTVKVTFELEEWKELKKIQDETVLIKHIIELKTTDV